MARWKRNSTDAKIIGAANKGECPEDSVPLWQAMNPFTIEITRYETKISLNDLVANHSLTAPYIRQTASSMLIVQLSQMSSPKSTRLKSFRRKVFSILPEPIVESLPEAIREKYGF